MKLLSEALGLILLLLITGCYRSKHYENSEKARWERHAANTEIFRDDFGVPHIYGKTDADAVFGLLYAQCEDDFNRVEQNYIWAIGRLAEIEGESALYSDLRARLFMTRSEAMANLKKSPPWLQELCYALADGINYYLATHPEVKPKLITHFEPWMPMYFSEGSIGGDIERVSTRKIREFYGEEPRPASREVHEGLIRANLEEPVGSNGFAIAGNLTQSGNAMLLINPHTSFYFRGEVHMVSEEGLNAYGAVTWGQFFIYQGFNENTGWMHTSTFTDVMDEYSESIIHSREGYKYVYGNELRPVESLEVDLRYSSEESIKTKRFTMFRTHHGPITAASDTGWIATAMMWDPVNALIQSFTRTKLKNHAEFRRMMDMRTNSSNNTVFADSEGIIAYYHGNFIPRRDTTYDFSKPVDGSNPATDWQGLHTVDEIITVFNPPNGWIQNCNSTPFTAAGEYSPKIEDYPAYMSLNNETFRGTHAIRVLNNARDLTLDKLIDLAYDPYLPGFENLIPGLIRAYDQANDEDSNIREAIDVLRKWDFIVSKESVAMSLAHFYGLQYMREGTRPSGMNFMERMDYYGTGSPKEERLKIFKQTIEKLQEDFGDWNTPWGEINRFQRLTGQIKHTFDDEEPSLPVGMASGRWGALASYGARPYNTKRIYGTSGNSFVAVVEFGERVKAKSILAGGQSGDSDSPHFFDQAQRYVDVHFKDVAYYREDVEKRAVVRYQLGDQ